MKVSRVCWWTKLPIFAAIVLVVSVVGGCAAGAIIWFSWDGRGVRALTAADCERAIEQDINPTAAAAQLLMLEQEATLAIRRHAQRKDEVGRILTRGLEAREKAGQQR